MAFLHADLNANGQASQTIDPDKPNPQKVDAAVMKLMAQFPATVAAVPSSPKPMG